MKAPKTTTWNISEVTRAKHLILRQYLSWWLPSMIDRYGESYILDGFAGPGEYIEGDYGSPLIALDILRSSIPGEKQQEAHFLFIEKLQKRVIHLNKLIAKEHPNLHAPEKRLYEIRKGIFTPVVNAYLAQSQKHGQALPPTFVFVDPFGFKDVPMDLITQLMRLPKCEVLLTFMYEEVNRFLSHPKSKVQRHFHALFGSDQWQRLIDYQNREERICNLYCDHMQQVGNVKYVCKFRMINSGNRTDYFLFFFTNNSDSLEQMKSIFWALDPDYGSTFHCNKRDDRQLHMFSLLPDYRNFEHDLLQRFGNSTISLRELDEYLLSETIFCRSAYKERLLKPLEQSSRIKVLSMNLARKPGEYTDMDSIQFQ